MYSALIVDDERFMREGIRKMIPWAELGFVHVETAGSGDEALKCISNHMPDLMITDIEMRNMNGIHLIRKINEINPDLRIIVLTGHDDFSYVQECCRMEVHEYLLKPVEVDVLTDSIKKQVDKMILIEKEKNDQRLQTRADILLEHERMERYFQGLLRGEDHEEVIRDFLSLYHWQRTDLFRIAIISEGKDTSNEWDSRRELQELSMTSVCYELLQMKGDGLFFRNEDKKMVLLLFEGEGHPDSGEVLDQIHVILQHEYDIAKKIYLGDRAESIKEIAASYRSAMSQIADQADQEDGEHENWDQLHVSLDNRVRHQIRIIEAAIKTNDDIIPAYRDFWHLLSESGSESEERRRRWIHGMTDIYLTWIAENHVNKDQCLTELIIQGSQKSVEDLFSLGEDFLGDLISQDKESSKDVIRDVTRYIDTHLDEELSVTKLAGQFYLSVAYFSKLFKKTMGVGCNYYIISKRMERAKILLKRPHVRVAKVAEMVGYQDVNYFSLTFKKYTGVSPMEYSEEDIGK